MANNYPAATRKTINQPDSVKVEAPPIRNRCTTKVTVVVKDKRAARELVKIVKELSSSFCFLRWWSRDHHLFLEPIIFHISFDISQLPFLKTREPIGRFARF